MPYFICINVLIAFAVQSHNQLEALFFSEYTGYFGMVLTGMGALLMLWKKFSLSLRYDIFTSGSILIWISTWPPFFNIDSPVIFSYPLFFCFMTFFIHFCFIQQASKIDLVALEIMHNFAKNQFWHSVILISATLISLQLIEHYRLFPSVIILVLLHQALLSILQVRANDLN